MNRVSDLLSLFHSVRGGTTRGRGRHMRPLLILLVLLLAVWGCEDAGSPSSPSEPGSAYATPLAYDRDSCLEWQLAHQASITLTAVARPGIIDETPTPATLPGLDAQWNEYEQTLPTEGLEFGSIEVTQTLLDMTKLVRISVVSVRETGSSGPRVRPPTAG